MKTITHSQHVDLKRAAKRLNKDLGITHSEALERLAKEAGYRDYHDLHQSEEDPRPHQDMTSSADEGYRQILIGSGEIWFAMDVKDAQKYDHATFPKRWRIKEDEGKRSAITDDIEKAYPEIKMDEDHPAQRFYNNNRVFSIALPKAKTLLDVVAYVREIFFWEPRFVIQKGKAFGCFGSPVRMDFKDWITSFGKPEDDEGETEHYDQSTD